MAAKRLSNPQLRKKLTLPSCGIRNQLIQFFTEQATTLIRAPRADVRGRDRQTALRPVVGLKPGPQFFPPERGRVGPEVDAPEGEEPNGAIVQFIVTLVQNNRLVSLKRKQPLLLNTKSSPKATILQTMVKETGADNRHVPHRTEEISDDIVIYDITDNMEEQEESSTAPENSDSPSPETLNCNLSHEVVIVEDDSEDEEVPVVPDHSSHV
ncbi:unnamed protein product [Ranitomeya imitator]|uniref:Vertebrate heat shock transcription factor C-terminal domain-containing protein n=1 Tax=Ranitomeya imitator TaxID=111125 RepID=A0ABN9LPG0_9NEOB|nr:unnamed protein product [Ranitomeya imitator]